MTLTSLRQAIRDVDEDGLTQAVDLAKQARKDRKTVFFIGNGGSAAIASHMAADWLKNGGFRAMCFNDGALLTCLANDEGYDRAFWRPLSVHAEPGDLLFAMSSSGKSKSITSAVSVALECAMHTVTLSGFDTDNPLRGMGDVNFHVASHEYGVVEVAHHAICHAILDQVMHDAG
jgi:D-sedoheptulose 7-phosphate isomerase